jgi:hypothetical protein
MDQMTQNSSLIATLQSAWLSGSAKAGTIADKHPCELRLLTEPNRARLRRIFLSDKALHGCRQTGNYGFLVAKPFRADTPVA